MRRIYLSLILSLFLFSGASGQSPFWTERFSTPEGWTLHDNWRIGGGILYFDWNPTIYNFDQQAVSPFITLDDNVEELIITQNLQIYNPTENEEAQLIIVVGDEEHTLWEYNLINGNWGNTSGTDLVLPMHDFAGETIQIKFRTFGETTFNWTWWQVFEVKVIAHYDYDLTITAIDGPNNIQTLQNGDWAIEVSNYGSETIDAYTVNLINSKSGNVVDYMVQTNSLAPGESSILGLSWVPDAADNILIYGEVVALDDQFPGNNLSNGKFLRIEPEMDYNILVWNNDNGIQSIVCPEYGDLITPNIGLVRALVDAGLEFDPYTYLPDNLSDYDIVISTMGCYCLS